MKKTLAIIAIASLGVLAGCEQTTRESGEDAARSDIAASGSQLLAYQTNQPIPRFDYSQLRQNLIDIETAQADTTATTSFMFSRSPNGATGSLVHWCPSIGFPIPSTFNLSAPDQPYGNRTGGYTSIGQMEPTGVFTGDTSGTYVVCVDKNGKGYAFYHEGDVSTIAGPARWNNERGEIEITGDPSARFSTAKS